MKTGRRKTAYLGHLFKNGRGHGLIAVFAFSKTEAQRIAARLANKKRCICAEVESRRSYARRIARFAVEKWIADAIRN